MSKAIKAKAIAVTVGEAYLTHKDSEAVQRHQVIGVLSPWRTGSLEVRGMTLSIEAEITEDDLALAASEAAWAAATPRVDGTSRKVVNEAWAAEGYSIARQLTALGATKASMKSASSKRVTTVPTWCRKAGVPAGTVVSTATKAPPAKLAPPAQAQAPQGMAFFGTQSVAPVGATGSDAKAKIQRLMAVGFSVDEALAMVGM